MRPRDEIVSEVVSTGKKGAKGNSYKSSEQTDKRRTWKEPSALLADL